MRSPNADTENPEVIVWGFRGFKKLTVEPEAVKLNKLDDDSDWLGEAELSSDTEVVGASVFGALLGNP